jgi:serine/threonine-protein kinase HipA
MSTAIVKLWGEEIGAITWLPEGYASFAYTKSFLKKGLDLAPFTMQLRRAKNENNFSFPNHRIHGFSLDDLSGFQGLPGLFAESLPDRFGTLLISYHTKFKPANPIDLLLYTGKRGSGALEYHPANKETWLANETITIEAALNELNKLLDGRYPADLKLDSANDNLDILRRMGNSAGGARAKVLIALNRNTNDLLPYYSDALTEEFDHWLLKFDGVKNDRFGSPEGHGKLEMAYHLMAKAAGIEMAECRLYHESGRSHFMTRRFDRPTYNTKLHFQSLHALQHWNYQNTYRYSYEGLFSSLNILRLPMAQKEQLLRRVVFNIAAHNQDDHTKNFGFLMDQNGTWRLAPAYDLVFTDGAGQMNGSQHTLSLNDKRAHHTLKDLEDLAIDNGIKKWKKITQEVLEIVRQWPIYAQEVGLSDELTDYVQRAIVALPINKQFTNK